MKNILVTLFVLVFALCILAATPTPTKTPFPTSTLTPISLTQTVTRLPTVTYTPTPLPVPIYPPAPTWVELISAISNILVGLSAVFVAIIGFAGLQQWRRELTGRTKFDIARKIAILAFQYRDEFKIARSPLTYSGESAERQKGANETIDEATLLNEYFARTKRLASLQEILRQLYEVSWEAEILLDKNIKNAIDPLENSFKKLFASKETYFQAHHRQLTRNASNVNNEWLEPHHKMIYGTIDDDISEAVDVAANTLVESLKNYIK